MLEHLDDLRRAYAGLDGLALLRALLKEGPLAGRTALVSSFGAESAVLLDMVATVDPATPVIFLDTGKLFAETHAYREELVDLLRLSDVRVVRPRAGGRCAPRPGRRAVEPRARPVLPHPQDRAAAGGARRASRAGSPGASASRPGCAASCRSSSRSGRAGGSSSTRWRCGPPRTSSSYRLLRNLPKHPLVDQGYRSIGCITCTRPVTAGEAPRAGRWWGLDKTECGIHLAGEAA